MTQRGNSTKRHEAAGISPHGLLIFLRDLIAGEGTPRQKLEAVATRVAEALGADACACFVTRPGDFLELFASSGLGHMPARTRVAVGEGAAGDVASGAVPIVSSSGVTVVGKPFAAFCGVPILRGGAVRGVLTVQNLEQRAYDSGTVETLQAVALLLAELISAGGIVKVQEISPVISAGGRPTRIEGESFGRGLASGRAVLHAPRLSLQAIVADDPEAEKKRLQQAAAGMNAAIGRLLAEDAVKTETEAREIMETYSLFARDRGWLARIEAAIDRGLTAEAAVQCVLDDTRARMMQIGDAYIRERLQDIEDVSNRLLSHLTRKSAPLDLPDEIVLVARSIGPAALLEYGAGRVKALVLEKSSLSSHSAIVARALDIPVVGQCGDVLNYAADGDPVIVDGDKGLVYLRPSQYVVDLYAKSMDARARRTSLYRRVVAARRSVTRDGVSVAVHVNAGLPADAAALPQLGADGIGLFRTELSFMGLRKYPLVTKQAELYAQVLDAAAGKPVVFRTLDIGGDKPLPYFDAPEEENPALGWRAMRIGMDRPAVLRTQFRALIMAAQGRDLNIMLPLVTEVAEFDRARALLEMEKARALKAGLALPKNIALGVMIEVPSLIWQLDTLLPSVDFVSVGSNDLMQYLFAADRGNDLTRDRYDPLSPAMLKVLKTIADQCRSAKVPASVCGEMAGNPIEAMVLIALGYKALSAPPASVEAIKMMIPTLDTGRLLAYLEQLMKSREHSVREQLLSFARDHQVNIQTA